MILLHFCYCDLLHFHFLAKLAFCGLNLDTFPSQNTILKFDKQDNRNLKYNEMSRL